MSNTETGSGGVEARPSSSLISFVSWMDGNTVADERICLWRASWGNGLQTPCLLACIQEGSNPVHNDALLCWSNKPGHLHLSLVVLGNPASRRPREEAAWQFPTAYPERQLNSSSSQFLSKIPTPVKKIIIINGGLYNSSCSLAHFPAGLDATNVPVW